MYINVQKMKAFGMANRHLPVPLRVNKSYP